MAKSYKFGGSTSNTPEGVNAHVIDYIKNRHSKPNSEKTIYTISAFGKSTNELQQLCLLKERGDNQGATEQRNNIRDFFLNYSNGLGVSIQTLDINFGNLDMALSQFSWNGQASAEDNKYKLRRLDTILGYGEILSTAILSACLTEKGIQHRVLNSFRCIHADDSYGSAKIYEEETFSNVKNQIIRLESPLILTQGFIALNKQSGHMVTLGREGSDLTAMIMAKSTGEEEVTLCKNVNGIYLPGLSTTGEPLSKCTYDDALGIVERCEELKQGQVVYKDAIKFGKKHGLKIKIAHYSNPDKYGTIIG